MTSQLNVDQMEKIALTLPTKGGKWAVKQTTRSELTEVGVSTKLTEIMIIGPGDHSVGVYLRPMVFRPNSTVSYWYPAVMVEAGWVTEGMTERA